ncbi:MAG: CBS domain-containing protein, partial [Verrucomicrobia bacterium]|nr:CBS domain-containing protein [Verrucomicrobiota bacterium]
LGNIVEFSTEDSIEKAISIAESSRRSRFPLCVQGDLDQILGVIHIKDLYAMRNKVRSVSELKPFLKKALFIPETAHLEKLLFRLLDAKTHFAVVVDEYGGTIGIVTMENILEELVGQIQDEFDKENYLIQIALDTQREPGTAGRFRDADRFLDRILCAEFHNVSQRSHDLAREPVL